LDGFLFLQRNSIRRGFCQPEELLEKRRGMSASLYLAGLADEVGFDAMLDAAGR
jgi:hypothetical protein